MVRRNQRERRLAVPLSGGRLETRDDLQPRVLTNRGGAAARL